MYNGVQASLPTYKEEGRHIELANSSLKSGEFAESTSFLNDSLRHRAIGFGGSKPKLEISDINAYWPVYFQIRE